jgi:anti-sigma factor RsiW
MKCRELSGFIEACLDAYLDGELDARECGEIEAHLEDCHACRSVVRNQACQKKLVRARAMEIRAPAGLKARLSACLAEEDVRPFETAPEDVALLAGEAERPGAALLPPEVRQAAPTWRSAPVFTSVAFLLVFVWVASGGFSSEPLVDDAVRKHARHLPLEVTGPADSLEGWLRDKVDFNPGVLIFPAGLEPLGARLSHVRDRPAVYIGYGRPGSGPDGERRASLFVFADPSFDPSAERQRHRRVRDRDVVVASHNGYNVVLWKENEVVYSLVADLDERELLALIEAAGGR